MRKSLIAVALLSLAACDGSARPTAPTSAAPSAGSHDVSANVSVGPTAAGKPTNPVGFTKVSQVISLLQIVAAGTQEENTAVCPAGTILVGGGFRIGGHDSVAPSPWIWFNGMDSTPNGWTVKVDNRQPGAAVMTFAAVAYCAS